MTIVKKHHHDEAHRIVTAELASFFVSPKPGAAPFDLRAAIAEALATAECDGYQEGYSCAEADCEDWGDDDA